MKYNGEEENRQKKGERWQIQWTWVLKDLIFRVNMGNWFELQRDGVHVKGCRFYCLFMLKDVYNEIAYKMDEKMRNDDEIGWETVRSR